MPTIIGLALIVTGLVVMAVGVARAPVFLTTGPAVPEAVMTSLIATEYKPDGSAVQVIMTTVGVMAPKDTIPELTIYPVSAADHIVVRAYPGTTEVVK